MSAERFGGGFAGSRHQSRNQRRALIVRRVAARAKREATRRKMSASAHHRVDRERMERGLDPVDRTIEHAGNPDHEIDQLPDSLLEDR